MSDRARLKELLACEEVGGVLIASVDGKRTVLGRAQPGGSFLLTKEGLHALAHGTPKPEPREAIPAFVGKRKRNTDLGVPE